MDKKRRLMALLAACIACLMLVSCGKKEEAAPEPAPEEEISAEHQALTAYKGIIEGNAEMINAYGWQCVGRTGEEYDKYENRQVAFSDIDRDGVPELFYMRRDDDNEYIARLYAYTFKDGEAKELKLDTGETEFDDHLAAAGVRYVLFSSKEPGELYLYYSTGDESMYYYIFSMRLDGSEIVLSDTLQNIIGPNEDYTGLRDDYFNNGEAIDDGEARFSTVFDRLDTAILFSGPAGDEASVWNNFSPDSGAGMSADEAIAYIDGELQK